jgi:hypothetical protein
MVAVTLLWLGLIPPLGIVKGAFVAVVAGEGLRFGLAQGLALRGLPFPVSFAKWTAWAILAAGIALVLGMETLKAVAMIGLVVERRIPWLQPGVTFLVWASWFLTQGFVIAVVQGALLFVPAGRRMAIRWAAITLVAFSVTEAFLDCPRWLLSKDAYSAWLIDHPWINTLGHAGIKGLLFSALSLPAWRGVLKMREIGSEPAPSPEGESISR